MNPEWKAKWIEALRSGKYEQTTGALRRVSSINLPLGMCCLGVLCDIVDPSQWNEVTTRGVQYYMTEDAIPPTIVYEKVGISCLNDFLEELPSLNDNGKTFLEIADLIEANL